MYDGIRHGAGACLRGAGNGRFRITMACRYQGYVHSAAKYKYPGAIVKELFVMCHPKKDYKQISLYIHCQSKEGGYGM